MDRLKQLRGEPGGSRDSSLDSSLDTTAPPSEGFLTANESSSKYFSLSEVDSSFDISPIKDALHNPPDATEGADPPLISDLSPINKKNDLLDSYRIGKLSEAANILSGGVEIFDDNDNSYDGDELVIDDNVIAEPEDKNGPEVKPKETEPIPSKDTEVVLQIQGKSVEAIDIGNGLYLYRKEGEQEELGAVQVVDPEQQPPNYKFLKVRANAEGNLEVYEEIEVVVPKNVPSIVEGKQGDNSSHVPIKDINQVISDSTNSSKTAERTKVTAQESLPQISASTETKSTRDMPKEQTDGFNGKMIFNEATKSPVISTFTPMTFHSTPNKEGIPLTKTMVDMQLHPSRHSECAKKTIEVKTDTCKKNIGSTISADPPPVAANAVIEISKVKDTSHNLMKVDQASALVSEEKIVEVCDSVELAKTEGNKDDLISHKIEKGLGKPSLSSTKKPEDLQKAKSAETSATAGTISFEEANTAKAKSTETSATVGTRSFDEANKAKSKTESKPETHDIIKNKGSAAAVAATAEPEIPSSSKIEGKPLQIKEVKVTEIENTYLHSKAVHNPTLENNPIEEKSTKSENIDTKTLEKSMETKESDKTDIKAKVVEDNEKDSEKNLEEKTVKQKLEQNSLIDKLKADNIKDVNLFAQKQEPSSIPPSNIMNKEVQLSKHTSVAAPSLPVVTLPVEDIKTKTVTKIAEETKSDTAQKCVEPSQVLAPEVKSDIARAVSVEAKTFKSVDMIGESTIEKVPPIEEIKIIEKTTQRKKSTNDLIQLQDLDVDLAIQSKTRESLERSLEADISRLDQQLITAQANVKAVKSEINKTASVEKAKPSEPMFTEKIKPNDLIIKAETKTNTSLLSQTKLLNNEFVNKHVSKAVLIRSPTNFTEQNKTFEVPKFNAESQCNALQRADVKKDIPKVAGQVDSKPKSINNNAPCNVPFGKWTEANKQEYLNKIRETKVPTNNTSQLKQANDLNRRDVLKKIESQRQSNSIAAANAAKNHEIMLNHNKPSVKNETTVFVSKPIMKVDTNTMLKTEANKPDSTRLTIGPNLTITPVLKQVETSGATSSTSLLGKNDPVPAHVTKTEFSAPNTANIAKRETPLQHPFNLTKKDISRHLNFTKRETASTSSTNITIAPSNAPIIAKQETSMPRAANLSKKDTSHASANVAKLEIISPPSNVTKKEVVSMKHYKGTTKDVMPLGVNLTKKEAQTPTKLESIPSGSNATKKETEKVDPKKDSTRPTNQDLIDKTIEDYLLMERRPMTMTREAKEAQKEKEKADTSSKQKGHSPKAKKVSPLDDIEMQMNELHGIPFIERPPHELPHRYSTEVKTYSKNESRPKVLPMSKVNKLPHLMPLSKSQDHKLKADDADELSEEEIIEHEPITGDIEIIKKDLPKNNILGPETKTHSSPKKDNVITENDFDKFVRRNSITYENCITVNYNIDKQLNVVQSVIGKDNTQQKGPSQSEQLMQSLQMLPQHQNKGISNSSRFVPIQPDDGYNANYHSKLQIAYQSALTAKQKNSPVTVLEDKPVKVVFIDNNAEFIPSQLNVQGKELSPAKRVHDSEVITLHSCDSMDSEVVHTTSVSKSQDEAKKHKHQRKQVLTPVEGPEPELIRPKDLGLEESPKKKRKPDDSNKTLSEKSYSKGLSKKAYILEPAALAMDDKVSSLAESPRLTNVTSAIDSLVKAAEMLESQSERSNTTIDSQSSQPTPVKRGRGRPRKYPLPDGAVEKPPKAPTPQKKPRVETKYDTSSEDSSDNEMIRENWTMGKINEDIVCPICNKLFRSENVVFKHVKHCTGPSPNRSDSGKRSRERRSQETDSKFRDESLDSMDLEMESQTTNKTSVSKDMSETTEELMHSSPIKSRRISEKRDHVPTKGNETRKSLQKAKATHKTNNLVCEFCGKTFRQLSYLVSHKIQHNNDDCSSNKDVTEKESASNKSTVNVFSCELCKKEFRKLHHLVQHRIIHNPPNMASKLRRKSSADNSEKVAVPSNTDSSKTVEDPSAGFRCEPCDKSFRKLHHLVEHRETHDGINRQKNTTIVQGSLEKDKVTQPPPQCDICKKTFRKLHHLIEHKEQHADLNSDKSDDKSVKSALSTKDIIHECSLCYMVFPNEHSLMKHTVICQRKKRQSKQTKPETEDQTSQESTENIEDKVPEDAASVTEAGENVSEESQKIEECKTKLVTSPKKTDDEVKKDKLEVEKLDNIGNTEQKALESAANDIEMVAEKPQEEKEKIPKANPEAIKTIAPFTKPKPMVIDTIVIEDTPKKEKKTPQRVKVGATVTKRKKVANHVPLQKVEESKPSSDEDEIRYMFNPNFKFEEKAEEKAFMKVRGLKRNSLQIERPKANLITRRTSLQNPPRVARLKPKMDPVSLPKAPKPDPVSSKAPKTDQTSLPKALKMGPTSLPKASKQEPASSPKALKSDAGSSPKAPKTGPTSLSKVLKQEPASSPKALKSDAGSLPKAPKMGSAFLPKASKQEPASSPKALKSDAGSLPKAPKMGPVFLPKAPKPDPASSTDSDDDVKYSFPTTSTGKVYPKPEPSVPDKKRRKSLADRRRSLGGIAKRKSVGKTIGRPLKQVVQAKHAAIKKRLPEAGHRCDCGQLFSSAALLSRHTTLAHTPPRIRRRRSPPPQEASKPGVQQAKPAKHSRKSSSKAEATVSKPVPAARKSSTEPQSQSKAPKNAKVHSQSKRVSKTTGVTLRRSAAHSGVPVPEKMRKLMEKLKK